MVEFHFSDKIQFKKAVFYRFNPIPLPRVFQDGTGGLGKFASDQAYVELYDTEGFCAHGGVTRSFAEKILPFLFTGEVKSYDQWRHDLYWKYRNSGFQSADAVDVGHLDLLMLDLLAQRAGKPLHRFLGAEKDYATAYKGGGSILLTDEELVEDMVRYTEEGYTTVKFKVGSGQGKDMERDVRRIEKVRQAVGPEIGVAVDANQRWSVEDAVKFAKMAEPYNLAWLEEPIHSHDMNGIRALKEMGVKQPLAFGESMRISYAYETYLEKGVDHLQPSIGRMSRIDDLFKIRDMARAAGKRFSSGGRIFLNTIFGCCYRDDEMIEYHEPINKTVLEFWEGVPEEKNGRFYMQTDCIGNPQRANLKKMASHGVIDSVQFFGRD